MISKISISVAMQASYYKCGVYTWKVREYVKLWQRLHLRTLFSRLYKTFIASLIAFRVVAKGMAAMAGFHATP